MEKQFDYSLADPKLGPKLLICSSVTGAQEAQLYSDSQNGQQREPQQDTASPGTGEILCSRNSWLLSENGPTHPTCVQFPSQRNPPCLFPPAQACSQAITLDVISPASGELSLPLHCYIPPLPGLHGFLLSCLSSLFMQPLLQQLPEEACAGDRISDTTCVGK